MRPNPLDAFAAAAILVALAACKGEEKVCVPGSTQTCVCPGAQGAQVCAADGARWEPCACVPDPTAARRNKFSECNALIGITNKGIQNLEQGHRAGSDQSGIGALRAMADAMDKVASDAGQVKLTIPELQKYSTDYQNMAKDVAKAAREMAAALEANDLAKNNSAQVAMERAVRQEDPIVNSLNGFCQAP